MQSSFSRVHWELVTLFPPWQSCCLRYPSFLTRYVEPAARSGTVATTSGREPKSSLKAGRSGRQKSVRFQDGGTEEQGGPAVEGEPLQAGLRESLGVVPKSSRQLAEAFWVLESWLSLREARSAGLQDKEHWDK